MTLLRKSFFVALITLIAAPAFSQSSPTVKPAIYASYPNSINGSSSEFASAINATEGQHIVLTFSDNFKFSGTVISNVVKYSNLQSVVIRSDESSNTIFHLSKQTNADNSVSYVGRIINKEASDGYEIKTDMSGNYIFQKSETEKVMPECKQ
ncbi:MAG: hypothetical protein U0T68_10300 [Ferruginibacter sp.]